MRVYGLIGVLLLICIAIRGDDCRRFDDLCVQCVIDPELGCRFDITLKQCINASAAAPDAVIQWPQCPCEYGTDCGNCGSLNAGCGWCGSVGEGSCLGCVKQGNDSCAVPSACSQQDGARFYINGTCNDDSGDEGDFIPVAVYGGIAALVVCFVVLATLLSCIIVYRATRGIHRDDSGGVSLYQPGEVVMEDDGGALEWEDDADARFSIADF